MRSAKVRLGSKPGRGRLAAGLAPAIASGVVVVLVISTRSPSPASGPSGPATGAGVTVQWRDLKQTDTESGTLGYGDPQTVYDRLSGTVTSLPGVGQVVKPGGTLYTVDQEPVILMDGTSPAYRDLDDSESAGADILQLDRNLVRLGFNPDGIIVDDVWQPATTAGVDALQASEGETETGSIALSRIVFLPGDQLISAVDATVGGTGAGGGSAASSATSANISPDERPAPEFVALERAVTTPMSGSAAKATPATAKPLTTAPSSSTATGPKPGGGGPGLRAARRAGRWPR